MPKHEKKEHEHDWKSDGYDAAMKAVHWHCEGCTEEHWLPVGKHPRDIVR